MNHKHWNFTVICTYSCQNVLTLTSCKCLGQMPDTYKCGVFMNPVPVDLGCNLPMDGEISGWNCRFFTAKFAKIQRTWMPPFENSSGSSFYVNSLNGSSSTLFKGPFCDPNISAPFKDFRQGPVLQICYNLWWPNPSICGSEMVEWTKKAPFCPNFLQFFWANLQTHWSRPHNTKSLHVLCNGG